MGSWRKCRSGEPLRGQDYEIRNGYRAKSADGLPIGDSAATLQAVSEKCRYEIFKKKGVSLKKSIFNNLYKTFEL